MLLTNPAAAALNDLSQSPIVRFSLLALSSIFFLVDPFAAIPSFLAITENADAVRRKRMARKGAFTCFVVLTSFAIAGQLIFRMFGAARRPRRRTAIPRKPRPKKTPASCPWAFPCWPDRAPSRL